MNALNALSNRLIMTKRFGDYPFAHRQPSHKGHCRLLHGHSWWFEVTLQAQELDACNFIMDFADFKTLREDFAMRFDHTVVVEQTDPLLANMQDIELSLGLFKLTIVPSASCEGLALYVFGLVESWLKRGEHAARVSVVRVKVYEDEKNSATYEP